MYIKYLIHLNLPGLRNLLIPSNLSNLHNPLVLIFKPKLLDRPTYLPDLFNPHTLKFFYDVSRNEMFQRFDFMDYKG